MIYDEAVRLSRSPVTSPVTLLNTVTIFTADYVSSGPAPRYIRLFVGVVALFQRRCTVGQRWKEKRGEGVLYIFSGHRFPRRNFARTSFHLCGMEVRNILHGDGALIIRDCFAKRCGGRGKLCSMKDDINSLGGEKRGWCYRNEFLLGSFIDA